MPTKSDFPFATTDQAQRILANIRVSASGCWEWTKSLDRYGYGHRTTFPGLEMKVPHRAAFYFAHGFWPNTVDHLCRNRKCCKPAHLEGVTHKENILRGEAFSAVKTNQRRPAKVTAIGCGRMALKISALPHLPQRGKSHRLCTEESGERTHDENVLRPKRV